MATTVLRREELGSRRRRTSPVRADERLRATFDACRRRQRIPSTRWRTCRARWRSRQSVRALRRVSWIARRSRSILGQLPNLVRRSQRRSEVVGSRPALPGYLSRPVKTIVARLWLDQQHRARHADGPAPHSRTRTREACCRDPARSSREEQPASCPCSSCSERNQARSWSMSCVGPARRTFG